MTNDQYEEWVVCGRLPTKLTGKPDLYIIERAMREEENPKRRVQLLKRVWESGGMHARRRGFR